MQATFTQGSLSVAVRFQDAPEECGIRNAELDLIRNAECGMRNYLSARVLHILNISVTRLLLNLRSGQDLTLQKSVLRIIYKYGRAQNVSNRASCLHDLNSAFRIPHSELI